LYVTRVRVTHNIVPPPRADAVELLDEATSRTHLYLGDLHRVRAQQLAIESATSTIREKRASSRVVHVVDCKMKFEALRYRETPAQFFGKKGLSWHGAAVYHLLQQHTSISTVPIELSLLF
jgi:hypothetical protein